MNDEVEVYQPHAPITLFGTDEPDEVMERATKVAKSLAKAVEDQNLYSMIKGKGGPRKHVKVEGWTLLGSLLGVFPVTIWSRPLATEEGELLGWEARVEAVTKDGNVVGGAEAECRVTEENWKTRDSYALRSMAQTRAASKALRMPLGFVMQLAGFDATPAEEMPVVEAARPTPMDLDQFELLIAALDFVKDAPEWKVETVLKHASRRFGRNITQLAELSNDEAAIIMEGIANWIEAKKAKEEPVPPAEDFESIDAYKELERIKEKFPEGTP